MKLEVIIPIVLLAAMLAVFAIPSARAALSLPPPGFDVLNIAGTYEGGMTRLSEGAIGTAHLLLKKGTANRQAIVCGATDRPIGTAAEAVATAIDVGVYLLGGGITRLMVSAVAAIAVDAPIYTTASGKVTNVPVAGCWFVGWAATQVTAVDQEFGVITTEPQLVRASGHTATFVDDGSGATGSLVGQVVDQFGVALAGYHKLTLFAAATAWGAPADIGDLAAAVGAILVEDTADALAQIITASTGAFDITVTKTGGGAAYVHVATGATFTGYSATITA
jgi:hypothetical protein